MTIWIYKESFVEEEESHRMEKLKALLPSEGTADTAGNNGAGSMHTQEVANAFRLGVYSF